MAGLSKLFGERVKALRSDRGMTQADLGERAQLSEEWIRRIERGEAQPSFQTVEALAGALDCAYGELFAARPPRSPDERLAAALDGLEEDQVRWLITGARLLRRR